MPIKIATVLLLSAAIAFAHVTVLVGSIVPFAFRSLFRLDSLEMARVLMPDPTRKACDHVWVFPVLIAIMTFACLLFARKFPEKTLCYVALGLSGQGAVV
jgi:hypothetical protein